MEGQTDRQTDILSKPSTSHQQPPKQAIYTQWSLYTWMRTNGRSLSQLQLGTLQHIASSSFVWSMYFLHILLRLGFKSMPCSLLPALGYLLYRTCPNNRRQQDYGRHLMHLRITRGFLVRSDRASIQLLLRSTSLQRLWFGYKLRLRCMRRDGMSDHIKGHIYKRDRSSFYKH